MTGLDPMLTRPPHRGRIGVGRAKRSHPFAFCIAALRSVVYTVREIAARAMSGKEQSSAEGTSGPEASSGRDRQCSAGREDCYGRGRGYRAEAACQIQKWEGGGEGACAGADSKGAQRDRKNRCESSLEALNVDQLSSAILKQFNGEVASKMGGDCVLISSPMLPPVDDEFRVAIEDLKQNSAEEHLIVIVETNGGLMETVERLVAVMRSHYERVSFVIPNYAYSAGTVLALSGDKIFMDYYSVLGPIDPQYRNTDGNYLPGYGYLAEYRKLIKTINEARSADKCRAELAFLVKKFDPGVVFRIEQAVKHGITLVTEWLPKHKFKDWKKTATKGKPVTPTMRRNRAKKIAETLGNAERWHSHGRGISMRELESSEIKLEIDDFGQDSELSAKVRNYHGLAGDYFKKIGLNAYIHTKNGPRRVA